MNFENYNKIYQEILEDNSDISANYLMNKYEISHEEELINILNQIKKNEYISSENTLINHILSELDENEELLDINEIIDIKEKIIDINQNINENDLQTKNKEESLQDNNTPTVETKQPQQNSDIKTKENKQPKSSQSRIAYITKNKNTLYSTAAIVSIAFVLSLYSLFSSDDSQSIPTQEVAINSNDINEAEELALKEDSIDNITEKVDLIETASAGLEEKIEKHDEPIQTLEVINQENQIDGVKVSSNEKITSTNKEPSKPLNESENNRLNKENEVSLNSLNDIEEYIKDLKYDNGNLYYKNKTYSKNDTLFGFKIYKITSVYVKLEDQKKHIRKRFMLSN